MNSEEKAFAITMAFEGGSYSAVSGNFDGQGISFGAVQFCLGQGTLQPVIKGMYAKNPGLFKKCCTIIVNYPPFNGKTVDLSSALLEMCKLTPKQAVQWAKERHDNNKLMPHWVQLFKNLGAEPEFQAVQRSMAVYYMSKAKEYMRKFGFKSERALALLHDITIQMGSIGTGAMARYNATAKASMSEPEKLLKLAIAMGPQGGAYSADVLSRKKTIAIGSGNVHGRTYNLERDFGLTDGPVV